MESIRTTNPGLSRTKVLALQKSRFLYKKKDKTSSYDLILINITLIQVIISRISINLYNFKKSKKFLLIQTCF
jgi:hypothetical protein